LIAELHGGSVRAANVDDPPGVCFVVELGKR